MVIFFTSYISGESPFLQKCLMKCQGVTTNFPAGSLSGGQVNYYVQQYAEVCQTQTSTGMIGCC